MSAESVGQIGLDLVVNKNDFQKQMGGIQKLASKAGKALAAAFAVKKLVDFGAECIELGSDLQEVQNVVDVAFPAMSKQVNEFAQGAAASFGLSETMAKKFTGTFGAMAKAFGFSESAAYDMSTTLTGLAGDIASFYNITQDEAYTKLKSVFTGETESLKDLGVVMTQTALDSYALANGFGKTTAKMTEAEKVALRYKFVQEQLATATGDFMRTSDGWANQVRVLKLQFDSLKATIGQGLINVLTPVIKVINTLVGKLMTLANAFKSFTEMITGNKGSNDASAQMQATAAAANSAASSVEAVGDAAASSTKKMKGLFAFDDMNVMASDSDTSGAGSSGYNTDSFSMEGVDTTAIDEVDSKYQRLFDKLKELAGLFKQGFEFGLGDTSVFDNIKLSLQSIKDSFLDIFTSSEVLGAFDNYLQTIVKNAGVTVGSFVSIGASIVNNLLSGISGYLEKNSEQISDYIASMFDIGSRITEIGGSYVEAVATVAESLRSDGATRITEAIIGGFSNAFMGVTELCGQLAADLLDVITGPFVDNQDLIRSTLEETFAAVAPMFEDVKVLVDECVASLKGAYDGHIAPMLSSFRDGWSDITTTLLEAYNTHILPIIQGMSEKFSAFKEQYLSPLIEKFGEFTGKVADAVNAVWTNALKPAIEEFITTWAPVIGEAINAIGQFFSGIGSVICVIIDSVLRALGGLMDFITGVFTGDWTLAWQGIKDFFEGIWNLIYGIVDEIAHAIWNIIMSILDVISSYFEIKFNNIKNTVSDTLNSIKNIVTNVFNSIWKFIKNIVNSILGAIETMIGGFVDGINNMISALNSIHVDIPDWVPGIGGNSFGISIPQISKVKLPRLAEGGYVKANTPQLAMIGDNLHQGEIVAPEDKIYQISAQAMKDVMQQFMSVLTSLMKGSQNNGATIILKVTGEMAPLIRLLNVEMEKEANRMGVDFKVVYE